MYFFINKGVQTLYKTSSLYEARRFYAERVRHKRAVDGRRLVLCARLEQARRTVTMEVN